MTALNSTESMQLHITSVLMENELKIKNYKIFFEEPIYDKEKYPTEATYTLHGNYILVSSPIREKRKILYKYTHLIIGKKKNIFFLLRLPENSQTRRELLNLLALNEIIIKRKIKITYEHLYIRHTGKKDIPNYWRDRIPFLKEELEKVENYTFYKPVKNPQFPIYIWDKSAESFIQSYSSLYESPYNAYLFALKGVMVSSTGLINQTTINRVLASIKDIRALLPSNITIDMLINGKNIIKSNNNIIFTFNAQKVNNLKFQTDENAKMKCVQIIYIPFSLLPHVFHAKSFGRNGFRYFLLLIFGYHCFKNPKVIYKPSTIIKLANLNTKRGINYLLQAINRPLVYMKKIGIIRNFSDITKEKIKEDKPIIIYLNPLKYWQPPSNKN